MTDSSVERQERITYGLPGGMSADELFDQRYQLFGSIGEGGVGTLYKARENELDRIVAIKVLQTGLMGDEESEARFLREGKILSSLKHKNIVVFYRFGVWRRHAYIAMEFLEGITLRTLIDRVQTLPATAALDVSVQACDALTVAHNNGIVHRDLKPSNIMLVGSSCAQGTDAEINVGQVKIVDFGLSRITTDGAYHDQRLTRTGTLIGTVYYMSPEQCLGRQVDARSDIYSLACVLYEMLTGEPPFISDNPIGLMHLHVSEPALPLAQKCPSKVFPTGLQEVVFKAMAKEPESRYQSMAQFQADLSLVLQNKGSEIPLEPVGSLNMRPRQRRLLIPVVVSFSVFLALLALVSALKAGMPIETTPVRKALSRIMPPYSSLGHLSRPERIDFCNRWLEKYGSQDNLQTAAAHYYLHRDLLAQSGGVETPAVVSHRSVAEAIYSKQIDQWKQQSSPNTGTVFIEDLERLVELELEGGESNRIIKLLVELKTKYGSKLTPFESVMIVDQICQLSRLQRNQVDEEHWLREYNRLARQQFGHDAQLNRTRALLQLATNLSARKNKGAESVYREALDSWKQSSALLEDNSRRTKAFFDQARRLFVHFLDVDNLTAAAEVASASDLTGTTEYSDVSRSMKAVVKARRNDMKGAREDFAGVLKHLPGAATKPQSWFSLSLMANYLGTCVSQSEFTATVGEMIKQVPARSVISPLYALTLFLVEQNQIASAQALLKTAPVLMRHCDVQSLLQMQNYFLAMGALMFRTGLKDCAEEYYSKLIARADALTVDNCSFRTNCYISMANGTAGTASVANQALNMARLTLKQALDEHVYDKSDERVIALRSEFLASEALIKVGQGDLAAAMKLADQAEAVLGEHARALPYLCGQIELLRSIIYNQRGDHVKAKSHVESASQLNNRGRTLGQGFAFDFIAPLTPPPSESD